MNIEDLDDDFNRAIANTANPDFYFDAPDEEPRESEDDDNTTGIDSKPFGNVEIAKRPSGSAKVGFHRPGERAKCMLDSNDNPYPIENESPPKWLDRTSGRAPTADEKNGTWWLQEEYLANRLGKDTEENSRLWNTALWIDKHYRNATTTAEATRPFNIYVGDQISQRTEGGAPAGPDDDAPDEKAENEGVGFESIKTFKTDKHGNAVVKGQNGTVYRLDVMPSDNHELLRLVDGLNETDRSAKIDVNKLMRETTPPLPQVDSPGPYEREESGKIIRILMARMPTSWHPVISSIADQVTMKSLGKSQGVGDSVAATVGRWRVIEGLRLAESIKKGLERQNRSKIRAEQTPVPRSGKVPSVREMMAPLAAPKAVRAPAGHYWSQARGPVIRLSENGRPFPANDNFTVVGRASNAA
jgi:hypothetical protein